MSIENVYIAFFINKNNDNLLSYNNVISLFNDTYPNNTLKIVEYVINGSIDEITRSLDDFINKYNSGKRVTISTTTQTIIECSKYFIKNGLNILNLSLSATANILQQQTMMLTYAPFNKYAVISNFLIYNDYQMKYVHVLYQQNTTNDLFLNDYLEQIKIQSKLLNIPIKVSFLTSNTTDYNIQKKSMVIILANTISLQNEFITKNFIDNFPKKSFIICTDYNGNINDIFGNIPSVVQTTTNINFTTLSEKVYNSIKNVPGSVKSSVYALYDILFVLNDFTTNRLEINSKTYTSVNPYKNNPPAWLLNTSLSSKINGSEYGKYQYTFTKDVIIGKNRNLFLKYYGGGQQKLPDSYSIFKIVGITPNNPSLIEYDEAVYYKIYDSNKNLVCVKYNSDIMNFPFEKNINPGITGLTKFIYKFNDEGYLIKIGHLFSCKCIRPPKVNMTMSKKTVCLKYIK